MAADDPVIRFEAVSFSYGGVPVLAEVGLAVAPGELAYLAGRSGPGKSTLLRHAFPRRSAACCPASTSGRPGRPRARCPRSAWPSARWARCSDCGGRSGDALLVAALLACALLGAVPLPAAAAAVAARATIGRALQQNAAQRETVRRQLEATDARIAAWTRRSPAARRRPAGGTRLR